MPSLLLDARYPVWLDVRIFCLARKQVSHHGSRFSEDLVNWTREDFANAGLSLDSPPPVAQIDLNTEMQKTPVTMTVVHGPNVTRLALKASAINFSFWAYLPGSIDVADGTYDGTLRYETRERLLATQRTTVDSYKEAVVVVLGDARGQPTGTCVFPMLPYGEGKAVSGYAQAKDTAD